MIDSQPVAPREGLRSAPEGPARLIPSSATAIPMSDHPIRFTDGAGYERFMGVWSRLVGEMFLDWIVPAPGL